MIDKVNIVRKILAYIARRASFMFSVRFIRLANIHKANQREIPSLRSAESYARMPYIRPRKDARVVEWNSLENCLSRKANEGSNPSLSAHKNKIQLTKKGFRNEEKNERP